MRRKSNVIRFSHVGDSLRLADSATMRNVRLDDVDASGFEVWSHICSGEKKRKHKKTRLSHALVAMHSSGLTLPRQQPLAKRNGYRCLSVQLLELFNLLGQEWLFNEQRFVRL